MRILTIFGTRPEAIKLAPLIKKLGRQSRNIISKICVTAQHKKLLNQVLQVFNIKPDYNLNIMKEKQDLFDVTSEVLLKIKRILLNFKPDIILVQGDTTTAMVASLAAFYLKIKVVHVEAGLRTYNKYSPFPEEINRRIITHIADYHFVPTEWAKSNLLKENIPLERIWVTGNTVIDTLFLIKKRQDKKEARQYWSKYFKVKWHLALPDEKSKIKLIFTTGHRRESFGEGFKNICMALKEIAQKRNDIIIVYPVHLNPNVQGPVQRLLRGIDNIFLIQPLPYEPFIFLMSNAYLILTDSGGVQEEAASLGKPVLILRDTTERPESIEANVSRLVGTDKDRIVRETFNLLDNCMMYKRMSRVIHSYGDGKSTGRIFNIILNNFRQP